jgi:hypothetical protein
MAVRLQDAISEQEGPMSAVRELVAALVAAGHDPVDAAAMVARAGAEMASPQRSAGAVRQQRYRENKRNEASQSVTPLRSDKASPSVTKRNESVTSDAPSLIREDMSKDKKRKDSRASQLPDGWRPSEAAWLAAVALIGEQHAEAELVKFRNHAADKGRTSKSWDAAWRNWIDNAIKFDPSIRLKSPDQAPLLEIDWEAQVSRFTRGLPWSTKWYGPEPGQLGCRVPPDILTKHGITEAA